MANESFSVTLDVQQGDLYPTSKVRVNILVHYLDERNLRRNSSRDCFVRTNHTRYILVAISHMHFCLGRLKG